MPGIRAFIAIEMPDDIRMQLATATASLARTEADVKWVETHNIHLTLKFLGDVAPERLPQLRAALRAAAADTDPFAIRVAGLGAFPSIEEPRVIWAGLTSGSHEQAALRRRIETVCADLGFAPERKPFSPHLTLGRQRTGQGGAALSRAISSGSERDFGSVTVSGFTLFRSDLRPSGPLYTVLDRFPLAGAIRD